ncbi:hypothetical protein KR084_012994, partial [Drosophila pseudotakahashii]
IRPAMISRWQPWMGQLPIMARNMALTLLLKLYRRTPIFRLRHLTGRNRIKSSGPAGDDTIVPSASNIDLSLRMSGKDAIFGGFVRVDLIREVNLDTDSDVEFVEDEDIFLDLQSLRRQGNFELAIMAGGQLDVDSEEDGDYEQDTQCEEKDDRVRDRIEGDFGQAGVALAASKGLQLYSRPLGSPTKRGNVAI